MQDDVCATRLGEQQSSAHRDYSVRRAAEGEIRLARNAGANAAARAEHPSVIAATRITAGS
jgi:hypothetical protein